MPGKYSSKGILLFDLDGTLVDSSAAHASAFAAALLPGHPDLAGRFVYAEHLGRPTGEVFASLGIRDRAEVARLTADKQRRYRASVDDGGVPPCPGVTDLLARLKVAGRRLFIVTGASRASAHKALAGAGIAGFFEGVITTEDAQPGKPDPAPYRFALGHHGLDSHAALAIEDSAAGVFSARGAGIDAILVNCGTEIPGTTNAGPVGNLGRWLIG